MTDSNNLNPSIALRLLTLVAELALLTGILILAGYLRLDNISENPAWYTDEMTHIDIAHHIARGEVQYMAVKDSTLLFGRMPLFHLLLASQFNTWPDTDPILILRTLTGALGTLSVALLYVAARLRGDALFALLAAFALAIFPQAVVYSRFGFSYNLLTVWMLLALVGLSQYVWSSHWLWLAVASLAVGLGTVTEVFGFILILPLVIVILLARRPLALAWALPLVLTPFTGFALIMLERAPDAFTYDLTFTLARLGGNPPLSLGGQLDNLLHNYIELVNTSLWMPLGFAGLFLLRPVRLVLVMLLLFWTPFISIGKSFALYHLSAYYLIPLLPFIALGVAAVLRSGMRNVSRAVSEILRGLPEPIRYSFGLVAGLLTLVVLVGIPMRPSINATFRAIDAGFQTPIGDFLIEPRDARTVAAYINRNSNPEDIVIVSPAVGWLINTHVSDFQMTAAAAGNTTPHLPGDLPHERWAFPMTYIEVRYVVVDNLWRNWGIVHVPGLDAILHDVETWPRVFEAGELRVYANPVLN